MLFLNSFIFEPSFKINFQPEIRTAATWFSKASTFLLPAAKTAILPEENRSATTGTSATTTGTPDTEPDLAFRMFITDRDRRRLCNNSTNIRDGPIATSTTRNRIRPLRHPLTLVNSLTSCTDPFNIHYIVRVVQWPHRNGFSR